MKNQFVGYKESKKLSKLGFSEECFGGYLKKDKTIWIGYVSSQGGEQFNRYYHILAPTFSQAFKFFRENHGYDVSIKKCTPSEYKFEIEQLFAEGDNYYFIDFPFLSHKEAELECLKKLIEITKEKK
jgi:hypothetical protein